MKVLASRKAGLFATLAALPFVSVASYFCIRAYFEAQWPEQAWLFWYLGTTIFLLGSPLTFIYAVLMPYIASFLMWTIGNVLSFLVIPVYVLLFVCQWIIWSQLIVMVWRRFKKRRGFS